MKKTHPVSWDKIFRKITLTKIPFPSKLSEEYYEKIRYFLPNKARILEVGSGSGEISGYLAKKGHDVYLLDQSEVALNLSKRLFSHYGLRGTFVHGNLFSIPFNDNVFDCVWNSGVLEHFYKKEIVKGLKEMSRVSNNLVITMVPSAKSVTYRIAKVILEKEKKWDYGDEFPKYTLHKQFTDANLNVVKEELVGTYFGLMWLNKISRIPNDLLAELTNWAESLKEESLKEGISYLLLTIGIKKGIRGKSSGKVNYKSLVLDKEDELSQAYKKLSLIEKELKIYKNSKFWKLYKILKGI